jgi:DNA invertase Pin-like site-specific DNA recombinase
LTSIFIDKAYTSTPTGRAKFQMVGVFAELERAVIRERRGHRDGSAHQGGYDRLNSPHLCVIGHRAGESQQNKGDR